MPLRIQFVKEEVTKNTVRYSEISTSFIGTLYLRKEVFNGKPFVERLTITLNFGDE